MKEITIKKSKNGKFPVSIHYYKMKLVVIFLVVALLSDVLSEFDPYVDNFGTIVGIAGRNFSLIAGDTRLSDQYMIRSRNHSKLFEVRLL